MKTLLAALALALIAPASAHDVTFRLGQPWYMDHHAYGPDRLPNVITVPYADEAAAKQRALADRHTCAPVHVWYSARGSFSHAANDCL